MHSEWRQILSPSIVEDNMSMLPARDLELIQIVDAALADATLRARRPDGSSWLACRPGCTPCCHGVFRISALDAERLRSAVFALSGTDAPRASRIQARAKRLVEILSPHFPGDPGTGTLVPEQAEDSVWETFADLPEADAPCPVLDPDTGRCDLYAARPLTCRIFGPPVQNEGGIGICELCYVGASEADVLRGEMQLEHHALEAVLEGECASGETIIAWAVLPISATPLHRLPSQETQVRHRLAG